MYRGFTISAVAVPVFNTLYFPSYQLVKEVLRDNYSFDAHSVALYSLSAGIAGTACSVITNPLWLIRTRMQVEVFKSSCDKHYRSQYCHGALSIFKNMQVIAQREGVLALWKGLPPTLIGIVHPLVFFPTYEKLKLYLKENDGTVSTQNVLLATVLSKILASMMSYPHEVIRARIQYKVHSIDNQLKKENMLVLARRMLQTEGVSSLYSGFLANLARILPNSAIIFVLYELLSAQMGLINE